MANTKRRTNISIDKKLWKRATEYGNENGRSLSSLIEQGLRAVLDGPPVTVEPTNLAPTPSNREELRAGFEAFLESPVGQTIVQAVLEEHVARFAPAPAPAPTSTPKASSRKGVGGTLPTVDISPELRERLRKFSGPQLMEATGMDRSSISNIRSGKRSRIQENTFKKVMAGLDKLESQSGNNPATP